VNAISGERRSRDQIPNARPVDMKLEVAAIPVADIDRAWAGTAIVEMAAGTARRQLGLLESAGHRTRPASPMPAGGLAGPLPRHARWSRPASVLFRSHHFLDSLPGNKTTPEELENG
jgi:hypothetical protein